MTKRKRETSRRKESVKFDTNEDFSSGDDRSPAKKRKNIEILKKNPSKSSTSEAVNKEEFDYLRESQNLYHSNLFRLQLNEIFQELVVGETEKQLLTSWLSKFEKVLINGAKSDLFFINKMEWKEALGNRFPLGLNAKHCSVKGDFQFSPPEQIFIAGSYAVDASIAQNANVDVVLILSRESIRKIRLMNGGWLLRRALYLGFVCRALEGEELVTEMHWVLQGGSKLRPILQLTPSGKLGHKWKINLHVVPPSSLVNLGGITPKACNINHNWYHEQDSLRNESSAHYNWLCGIDYVLPSHNNLLKETITTENQIRGLLLLKLWLHQRKLNQVVGGFSSHVMSMLLVHLIQLRKVSNQMSHYQVFRSVILHLSQHDWCNEGIAMQLKINLNERLQLTDFHQLYPVVFVDQTGVFNIAGGVSTLVWKEIKMEAQKTIASLETFTYDNFDSLFINSLTSLTYFDYVIEVKLTKISTKYLQENDDLHQNEACRFGDMQLRHIENIAGIMQKGLGERVLLVGQGKTTIQKWSTDEGIPTNMVKTLQFGLILHPSLHMNLLTKGPSAEFPECESFRCFWGEKSELRRFKDGSFHEAVQWADTNATVAQKRRICEDVVKDVLYRHLHLKNVLYIGHQFDQFMCSSKDESPSSSTGEETLSSVIHSYESLCKLFKSLPLPLSITTIQSPSPIINHTTITPPAPKYIPTNFLLDSPKDLTGYIPSIDMYLHLETSGKWPDNLLAVAAIKAEFHTCIANLLQKQNVNCKLTPEFIYVLWQKFVFSVRVVYPREVILIRNTTNENVTPGERVETEESMQKEKELVMKTKTRHILANLHSEFPSYSVSVRLIKIWLSSQLLLPHIPCIVVEILVAHLFLHPSPFDVPHSPFVALCRFWHLMAQTRWAATPLLVNLADKLTVDDERFILKTFSEQRSLFPPLCVVTPCELRDEGDTLMGPGGRYHMASVWTRERPCLMVLNRVKLSAKSATECLEQQVLARDLDGQVFFSPSIDVYDVIISLQSQSHITSAVESFTNNVRIDFDPVQWYMKQLEESFSEVALFFYASEGGSVIGVVWKPDARRATTFKVGSMQGHRITTTPGELSPVQTFDTSAAVETFRVMGQGIVKTVTATRSVIK